MPSAPVVAAVVLNWNGREMTLDCLRSLAEADYTPLLVVVVDNASEDGSIDAIRNTFPSTMVCANERNLGFAGGMNVGIRWAMDLGADYVLLLNNDTMVDPSALRALVDSAAEHPGAGAVSPVIYFASPSDIVWFAGATFDPKRGYPGRMMGYGKSGQPNRPDDFETARLTGAAMLITRSALETVGLLDEDLFFMCEDTDWSLRARRAGYRLYVAPRAKVWHRVARSQGGEHSPASTYYGLRNQLEVCRRFAPLGRLASARRSLVATLVYLARIRRAPRPGASLLALADGIRDARARRLGPWGR